MPDEAGIAETRELYTRRFGMEITDEQAADVLGRVMRFIYLAEGMGGGDSESPSESPPADESG